MGVFQSGLGSPVTGMLCFEQNAHFGPTCCVLNRLGTSVHPLRFEPTSPFCSNRPRGCRLRNNGPFDLAVNWGCRFGEHVAMHPKAEMPKIFDTYRSLNSSRVQPSA